MAEEQKRDPILGLVCQFVIAREKLESSAIAKIKSKAVRKYFLEFGRLTFKQGGLYQLYINDDVEYHQMILPVKYQAQVPQMLHDSQGYQVIELEHFYWNTMYRDVAQYTQLCL